MKFGRQIAIKILYVLVDVFFLGVAIYVASQIRPKALGFETTIFHLFFDNDNPFRNLFYFWALVTVLVNNSLDLYQTKREIYETEELWQVVKGVFLTALIIIVSIYLAKILDFPRTILTIVAILSGTLFASWRLLKRMIVSYLVSQGYNNFNVLIAGAGKVGHALVNEIDKRPGLGINIVGFLDDFKQNDSKQKGPMILGKLSDFKRIARREFIQEIFITCHHDGEVTLRILEQAKEIGVAIRVIPHGFELMSGEFIKYNIGIIPILEFSEGRTYRLQAGKRIFDFIATFCVFIPLVPFYILIAFLIKLDSPGPIFYLSRRYGRSGHIFNMYKFRSMVKDADKVLDQYKSQNETDGPIFKIKKDPRITKFGKMLRKYSIDELPQLLNVLKGEMSLVGPRPLPITQIEKEDLRQLRRLEVRPGITGLWQIRGRSDISFSRLVKWDVWYINNWSFWLDFNILYQTIPVVLKGRGAY